MPRAAYTLDTDDKRLIDDAIHVVGEGSLRKLAAALGRSEASLRHVLSGRTAALDMPTRMRVYHLVERTHARNHLVDALGERWAAGHRSDRVLDHIMTCRTCMVDAAIRADRHFTESVARLRRND